MNLCTPDYIPLNSEKRKDRCVELVVVVSKSFLLWYLGPVLRARWIVWVRGRWFQLLGEHTIRRPCQRDRRVAPWLYLLSGGGLSHGVVFTGCCIPNTSIDVSEAVGGPHLSRIDNIATDFAREGSGAVQVNGRHF